MPRNIQTMSADIENLVESSTNLGVVVTENDSIKFEFATRSSVKTLKDDIKRQNAIALRHNRVNLYTRRRLSRMGICQRFKVRANMR